MPRTQDEILARMRALYPAVWVIDSLVDGLAVYQGIAKIFAQLEIVVDEFVNSTQVLLAEDNRLDLHAKGRGLVRGESELDPNLRTRIRTWDDQVTIPALEAGINALLETKGAYIDEHLPEGGFADRQVFFSDRGMRHYDDRFYIFTAYIPWQVSELLLNAFADRQISFADRQVAFADDLLYFDQSIYKRVYDYIDNNRAAGVRFIMVIE